MTTPEYLYALGPDGASVTASLWGDVDGRSVVTLSTAITTPGGSPLLLTATFVADDLIELIARAAGLDAGPFLDIDAFAERVGLQPETLRSYRKKAVDRFPEPDTMFGRTPVWRVSKVDAWARSRRRVGRPKSVPFDVDSLSDP